MDREAIYGGFWTALQAAVAGHGFKTVSRRLKHWVDTPAAEQPALFQTAAGETARQDTGKPAQWELRLKIYLYATWDDGTEVFPLNPLLDAVTNFCNARNPVTGRHPLVGQLPKVETVAVEGVVETDEGVLGDQQIAIIPIVITVTN